jgi:hypothetical protein
VSLDNEAMLRLLRESDPSVRPDVSERFFESDAGLEEDEDLRSRDGYAVVEPQSSPDISTKGLFSTTEVAPSAAESPSTAEERPPTWKVKEFAVRHGWPADQRIPPPQFRTWSLRLQVESGLLRPYTVNAGKLPEGVGPIVRRHYEGFVFLLACKWIQDPHQPSPFAHDFAAMWCGITAGQAKDARSELVKIKMLEHVGDHGRLKLWLPAGVAA